MNMISYCFPYLNQICEVQSPNNRRSRETLFGQQFATPPSILIIDAMVVSVSISIFSVCFPTVCNKNCYTSPSKTIKWP